MKTAMQELIENLTEQLDKVMKEHQTEVDKPTYWRGIKNALETAIELAQLFSEKEKEQKRKDFTDGYMHGNEPLNHDVIDKWYEQTYGGNK